MKVVADVEMCDYIPERGDPERSGNQHVVSREVPAASQTSSVGLEDLRCVMQSRIQFFITDGA